MHSGRTLEHFSQFRLRKVFSYTVADIMQVKMKTQEEALSLIMSKLPSCSSVKKLLIIIIMNDNKTLLASEKLL